MIDNITGKLAYGFLAERIGIIRTVIITKIATGIGILLILILPDIATYLLLPLIGIALNNTSSMLYTTINDLVEKDQLPHAFGLFYTLSSICKLITPLMFGMIGNALDINASITLIDLLVFLTLPLYLMLKPALHTARA